MKGLGRELTHLWHDAGVRSTRNLLTILVLLPRIRKRCLRYFRRRDAGSNRVELALRYTNELETGMYDGERLDHETAELESRAQWLRRAG